MICYNIFFKFNQRWEEEIKKDIPKPECLISKNPSNYDEKDIESIKLYDEKVNKLEADREQYKTYLESEILRIDGKLMNNNFLTICIICHEV